MRYAGRAVISLEQYPQLITSHRRFFAIRVLEFLTPMKRISTSDGVPDPIPGELLMRRYQGRYIPYGYSPWKADTCATIAAWINAQSNL